MLPNVAMDHTKLAAFDLCWAVCWTKRYGFVVRLEKCFVQQFCSFHFLSELFHP